MQIHKLLVISHKFRALRASGTESLLVDCLSKTQVRAKAKAEVYGLTLVQCR